MKNSSTNLSDCARKAHATYADLVYLEGKVEKELTDDDLAFARDAVEDLCFYLNSLLVESTPDNWTDEEYQWIKNVCSELKEAHL